MFVIREINANDKETVTQLIIEDWGSSIVVSKGKTHDVSSLPGFVAESDGKIASTAIHINTIRKSREIKPQIPLFGFDNIPILNEIEFE